MQEGRNDRVLDKPLKPQVRQDVNQVEAPQEQFSHAPQQSLEEIEQEFQEYQDMYGDEPGWKAEFDRRFTDGEDNLIPNPLDWNLLGWTSQVQTPEPARKLYEYHFDEEDKQGDLKPSAYAFANGVVRPSDLDDGSSPSSREALSMTGEQYYKYRTVFGIPGRPIEDIDPSPYAIYSKQEEQDKYGFIPYITSEESLSDFHDEAAPHALSSLFNHLANARRENTDFTVNYDGKEIDGHDLIRQGNLWWARNAGKEHEVVTDPAEADENAVPYTWTLRMSDGTEEDAPSSHYIGWTDPDDGSLYMMFGKENESGEVEYPQDDGTGNYVFSDGSPGVIWSFDDEADYQDSLMMYKVAEGDMPVNAWRNIEPLVLDDGTVLRADQAEELLSQNNYENYADYGDYNWSKPYIEDPFKDDQGKFTLDLNRNSFVPWIADTALGSIPYFYTPTAAAQGLSNAFASYTGFKPGYQDFLNGTYSMLSDDPTREQQMSATTGSLVQPVTEHLWGNLGGRLVSKPLMRALGKNEKDIHPLARYTLGAVSEGPEEILGNLVEPFQQGSGFSEWYADDMYRDAEGNLTTQDTGVKAYDNQGNVIKNPETEWGDRWINYAKDAPLAAIGGVTLGATIGAPAIKGYYNEYTPRKKERDKYGNNLVKVDLSKEDPDLVVDLMDEDSDYDDYYYR